MIHCKMSVITYKATGVLMHGWTGAACNLLQCFCHNRRRHVIGTTRAKTQRIVLNRKLSEFGPLCSTHYDHDAEDFSTHMKVKNVLDTAHYPRRRE